MDSASWQLFKHLWDNNTGIAIIASHTANVTTKKGVDLNLFHDFERIYIVNLKPLGLAATKLIANAIFESNHIKGVGNEVYEKLYTMSGGNALFLYELAKAMLEWYHNTLEEEMAAMNQEVGDESDKMMPTPNAISFSAAIQDFRTTRIEEVICYRFDQFDTAVQLLLKLASVACANGEVFTLKQLNHMIKSDNGDNVGAFSILQTPSQDMDRDVDDQEYGDTVGFERANSMSSFDGSSIY